MKVKEIIEILEEWCPKRFACEWDNVGLHVGRFEQEVHKVLITVDVDDSAISQAIACGADLIVAHHPFMFHGVRQLNDADFIGARALTLMEHGISCYCMHTNFDVKGGMATEAARRLKLTDVSVLEETLEGEGIGRIGKLQESKTIHEVCEMVKEAFALDYVNYYGDENKIVSRLAIVPGSGKDDLELCLKKGAEVYVTGDMTYHYAIDSVAQGMAIIDAGHYGIEQIFIELVSDYLKAKLPELPLEAAKRYNPRQFL